MKHNFSKFLLKFPIILLFFTVNVNAETIFNGVYEVTAVNGLCPLWMSVNNIQRSTFHPAITGNNNFSSIITFWDFGGSSYQLSKTANNAFTTSYKSVDTRGFGGWGNSSTQQNASILILTQTPVPSGTVTQSTTRLTVTGRIKNPSGQAGNETCETDFTFTGLRDAQQ